MALAQTPSFREQGMRQFVTYERSVAVAHAHAHTNICTQACTHDTRTRLYTCINMHVCMHERTHARTRLYACTYKHACTHASAQQFHTYASLQTVSLHAERGGCAITAVPIRAPRQWERALRPVRRGAAVCVRGAATAACAWVGWGGRGAAAAGDRCCRRACGAAPLATCGRVGVGPRPLAFRL